ncbi:hypothetical protein [Flavobacterium ovatum]|uniref:hypothetical protein n=1 Tax=Flavobacterium ovatum TaxID=1928857 RepID=UPI0034505345
MTGFTKFLLFSTNAFLARILVNEKAETLGPSKFGVSFFTGTIGVSCISEGAGTVLGVSTVAVVSFTDVWSAIE